MVFLNSVTEKQQENSHIHTSLGNYRLYQAARRWTTAQGSNSSIYHERAELTDTANRKHLGGGRSGKKTPEPVNKQTQHLRHHAASPSNPREGTASSTDTCLTHPPSHHGLHTMRVAGALPPGERKCRCSNTLLAFKPS